MGQSVLFQNRIRGPPRCGKCTRNLAIFAGYIRHHWILQDCWLLHHVEQSTCWWWWNILASGCQNSIELATVSFLDHVLAYFGASTEVQRDQGWELVNVFEEWCTKALIDHHTTLRDHPELDGLVEWIVQTTRCGLRKYGLFRGSHWDWDLMLLWITMGYQFSRVASLAS